MVSPLFTNISRVLSIFVRKRKAIESIKLGHSVTLHFHLLFCRNSNFMKNSDGGHSGGRIG